MIIGKNSNLQHHNNFVKNNTNPINSPTTTINPKVNQQQNIQHANIMSKQEMNDRAFTMLQDRLNKGLISIEEFNKMCSKLGKSK